MCIHWVTKTSNLHSFSQRAQVKAKANESMIIIKTLRLSFLLLFFLHIFCPQSCHVMLVNTRHTNYFIEKATLFFKAFLSNRQTATGSAIIY